MAIDAKIISVVGEKGGSGKSTIAHLLGHGAGSLPTSIVALVFTTDPADDLVAEGRRYLPMDGRNLAELPDLLQAASQKSCLIIIDGAAGRPELDQLIETVSDLILVPFGPAHQDISRAAKDLARLKTAYGLPNRWPAHPAVRERADAKLEEAIAKDRRLPVIGSLPRADELLSDEGYRLASTPLSRPGQKLVLAALHKMSVHPMDFH